jgi:hypothetical protein
LLKKRSFDVAEARLFDRMIFSVVHGFDSRICPPPIGQTLMAVAPGPLFLLQTPPQI